jgi:putative DNA primase/helicase
LSAPAVMTDGPAMTDSQFADAWVQMSVEARSQVPGGYERYGRIMGPIGAGLPRLAPAPTLAPVQPMPARRFEVMTAAELANLPPIRWRVRDVLPEEGLCAVYGPSGSGKSFLVLDMLGAIAEGRTWFGCRTEPCPVIYVALEGQHGIAQRVAAYKSKFGSAPAALRFVAGPLALLEPADVFALAAAIRSAGGSDGVTVIDTLARAAPGADENSGRDMGELIAGCTALQAELGGVVLLVHHAGKNVGAGLRGHSSLLAALDSSIEVRRDGANREWQLGKAKDAADGAAHPFRLEVIELGHDDEGEPITSCVVVPADGAEPAKSKLPGAGSGQRAAWDALGQALRAAGDGRPKDAPDSLPSGRPALTTEAALDAISARLVVEPKRRRERARLALQGLIDRGLLHHDSGWVWCA